MKRIQLLIVRSAALAALAIAISMPPVSAETFDVTTTADGNDGVCDTHCTLREAIVAANVNRNRDIINLPPGTYRLEIEGREKTTGLRAISTSWRGSTSGARPRRPRSSTAVESTACSTSTA